MTDEQIEINEVKARLLKLETTVNKSNFSAGLALALDNIRTDIRSDMLNLIGDNKHENTATKTVELTMFVLEHALMKEADRLRQKG